MTKEEIKDEVEKAREIPDGLYMMGTKAYHQLGEISSDSYDIFYTAKETENYYVGSWITGYGFFNVCFPKATSRKLTPKEVKYYSKEYYAINSQPAYKLTDVS